MQHFACSMTDAMEPLISPCSFNSCVPEFIYIYYAIIAGSYDFKVT